VAFVIMLISSPLIELSSNFNQKMVLPEFLKGLERWMKESEEKRPKNYYSHTANEYRVGVY
jgi:hypothetical protein